MADLDKEIGATLGEGPEKSGKPDNSITPIPEISDATAEERDAKDKEETFADISEFLKKHNPQPPVRGRRDALDDRYLIKMEQRLPELDTELCQAYAAVDDNQSERKLYALVCRHDIPYRIDNMRKLTGFDHHSLMQLVAAGTVEFSAEKQCRMAVVHEYPRGKTIRELLKERKSAFSEKFLIDDIIAPICDVLANFKERNISHGRINIDTVRYGDRVQLGECVSEPAGYSQHFHFETTERQQALPLGKGETSIASDCYALGVLILHMSHGLRTFEKIEARQYMTKRLTLGTYNVLIGAKEYKGLEDFLKGTLNDDPAERWGPDQIEQWVKGKKYNLLTPSILREAQRPFDFLGEDYFNRRALAHSFYENWEEAIPALRSTHLSRWVEVSLHKNDMADSVRRVMEKTGGTHSINEKSDNELVTRTICLLDPDGPVRYNMIASFVDGIGPMLAEAFKAKDQKQIQAVIEIIDHNFFNYINELLDGAKTSRYGNLLHKLQSCSRYLRMQAMGFGIERILYELNPGLACQSPLLKQENVLTIEDLLGALDRMGTRKSKGFDYLDRHIAAFIANRMEISKEVKIQELQLIPALAQNPQMIVLYMLTQSQRKAGRPKLKGLSSWAALKVVPLIDNFHSRTARTRLRNNLKSAARIGDLDKIFELLCDQTVVRADHDGYRRAVFRFTKNARNISKMRSRKRLRERSEKVGTIFAMIVGYTTLMISVGVALTDYFGL